MVTEKEKDEFEVFNFSQIVTAKNFNPNDLQNTIRNQNQNILSKLAEETC